MKILLLSGASSVHTVRWANGFALRGHKVHLVTQHAPIDPLDVGVHVHRFPHYHGAGYYVNGLRLRTLVRELAVDVVNAHYATGYGTLAGAVGKVPLVLNVWGSDVYDFPEGGPLHRALVRRNLRRADRVVSTSYAMAERTRLVCPGLKDIAVVPFGVDTAHFRPSGASAAMREGLVLGTVKTLAPKYGVDTLIDTFVLLSSKHPGLRLRIVGTGPQESELKERADRHGISGKVDWCGRVPHSQVPEELRKLDIYAALSKLDSESFGVAVIEASACGLPVVVSDVGGLPEVVEEGITGFVVPRNSAMAASDRIDELLRSPELRAEMGKAAVKHVKDRYEWEACLDRMLEVLRETAEQRNSR